MELDRLPVYVRGRLQELKYGQKGELAQMLGISVAQLSHYVTGTRPIPGKYIAGILVFFDERVNVQIKRADTEEVIFE
ncbi:helix-turn-helix domain-containing protein [Deinococcus rufus]|uniref:Helix-turn-helix domain-containing protein n=1 Tax=Deinococcus rufus TaxID=2136097 RepID=A0ABV7ZA17_9DEIO